MGGGVETRSEEEGLDVSGIARTLGPRWRLKFSVILLCALTATLLLTWLARRALMRWCRSRRVAPQPPPPPAAMCTVCLDDVEQGAAGDAVTLPCGHHYHRRCIAQVVEHDPRCPVCRASVSPADIV